MKVLNKIVPDKGLINNTLNFSEENYTTNLNIIKVIIERIKKIKNELTNEFENYYVNNQDTNLGNQQLRHRMTMQPEGLRHSPLRTYNTKYDDIYNNKNDESPYR